MFFSSIGGHAQEKPMGKRPPGMPSGPKWVKGLKCRPSSCCGLRQTMEQKTRFKGGRCGRDWTG